VDSPAYKAGRAGKSIRIPQRGDKKERIFRFYRHREQADHLAAPT